MGYGTEEEEKLGYKRWRYGMKSVASLFFGVVSGSRDDEAKRMSFYAHSSLW